MWNQGGKPDGVRIILLSLRDYHDNNSWAGFEILGDGISEGVYLYKCSPNQNVREGSDWKCYGKGETIELGYASFTVNRVDIGSKEGVSISSKDELVYAGKAYHKIYLEKGDTCEIRTHNGSSIIKLIGISYQ